MFWELNLRAIEAHVVGADAASGAGGGAGLQPVVRLAHGARRAAGWRAKALSDLGLGFVREWRGGEMGNPRTKFNDGRLDI